MIQIAGVKIKESLKIQITSDYKFIISNSGEEKIEYSLRVYEERFSIFLSDYVIALHYKFDKEGKLLLTNKRRVGESKIKPKKILIDKSRSIDKIIATNYKI